jgi:hypothetical protein
MTRKEAVRQTHQENALLDLGFTRDESEALRRISMTLHRWHERECGDGNGCIERDEMTGKTYWLDSYSGRRYAIADRETGARKRLVAIIAARNDRALAAIPLSELRREQRKGHTGFQPVSYYVQGDPRGAALYIIRPGDVPEGASVDSCYTRGICVY